MISLRCDIGTHHAQEDGRPLFWHVFINHGWGFALLYLASTFFVTFGLFNVIVAIFVENVVAAARTNETLVKRQRSRDKLFFANKMTQLVELISAMQDWSCLHVCRGSSTPHRITLAVDTSRRCEVLGLALIKARRPFLGVESLPKELSVAPTNRSALTSATTCIQSDSHAPPGASMSLLRLVRSEPSRSCGVRAT